jgi:hypothetical protein
MHLWNFNRFVSSTREEKDTLGFLDLFYCEFVSLSVVSFTCTCC